MEKSTVEDVAREAGLSRATVYRTFPGGRDELIREVVAWQIGAFFSALATSVAACDGFEEVVEVALVEAHRAVGEHALRQKLLLTERDRLGPTLTSETSRVGPPPRGGRAGSSRSSPRSSSPTWRGRRCEVASTPTRPLATSPGWSSPTSA